MVDGPKMALMTFSFAQFLPGCSAECKVMLCADTITGFSFAKVMNILRNRVGISESVSQFDRWTTFVGRGGEVFLLFNVCAAGLPKLSCKR